MYPQHARGYRGCMAWRTRFLYVVTCVAAVCFLLLVVRLYASSGIVKLTIYKMQSRTWYDGKDALKPPSLCDIYVVEAGTARPGVYHGATVSYTKSGKTLVLLMVSYCH